LLHMLPISSKPPVVAVFEYAPAILLSAIKILPLTVCCSSPSSVCLPSWKLENKFHPWMLSYYCICTNSLYNDTTSDSYYVALNYGMVMSNELEGSGYGLI
jgi:hypothetical protein